jgi:anaerobic selenocysteine-containing dehydrogenase
VAIHTVKGCCPLDCQDTCAWEARVEDGRVTRVTGQAEHPITRGSLCAKVNDYQERTYAPDRLLHPLKRVGPKGAGAFERITWDEALDTMAARLRAVVDEFGGEAILPVCYAGSMGILQRRALARVFNALGASSTRGGICMAAGITLQAEGHPIQFDPEEMVDSRLILLWGANLLTTSHHHFRILDEARRRHGTRIVAIDPRATITTRACDEHLSVRPGTDAILAAGLANVIVTEKLADLAAFRAVAADADAWLEQVRPWTPERTAAACGLADATIVTRLAREFAAARPAVIRCGVAPMQTAGGEEFVRALSALAILCGHWNHPGGGLFIAAFPRLNDLAPQRKDLAPGTPRSLELPKLGKVLTDPDLGPPVKAFVVWTMNPMTDQPDAARVEQGLRREDLFTVVIEHTMTDTARYADIVLPSTTQLEHFDIQGAWGHSYISLNNPAIPPLGEARSHADIMRALAPRLGLTDPAFAETDEQIAASALPEDVTLADLATTNWKKAANPRPNPAAAGRKLRFAGGVPEPPVAPPNHFQLLTPKSHWFLNSTFVDMPRQQRSMKRPTLEMNEQDAARLGLTTGDAVRIANPSAAIVAWLATTADTPPGVVALPGKWWAGATNDGALASRLVPASWTPGGQPAYNDTFVTIERAT